MEVSINRKTIQLPKPFASGGEARVYKVDDSTVAKVYKLPKDVDIRDDNNAISGARIRLVVAQLKVPLIPKNLPPSVITPIHVVRDPSSGFIIGYTMPFVKSKCTLSDLRVSVPNITDEQITNIFIELCSSVNELHSKGIVLGDFNDKNILIDDKFSPRLIDIDSVQFGAFRTKVFTEEFVDPLICQIKKSELQQIQLHSEDTDWYAWWTMFFQTLMRVHPYGGTYKPKDRSKQISHMHRGINKIWVGHPDVIYPRNSRPLSSIPPRLLEMFEKIFSNGERFAPQVSILQGLKYDSSGQINTVTSHMQIQVTSTSLSSMNVNPIIKSKASLEAIGLDPSNNIQYVSNDQNSLFMNETHMITLKSVKDVDFCVAGSQFVMANASGAIVKDSRWNDRIAVNSSIKVATKYGYVFFDDSWKMIIGRTTPVSRVLDLLTDKPHAVSSDGETIMVLYGDTTLKLVVHHVLWDRTISQISVNELKPHQISKVQCIHSNTTAWVLIETTTGDNCCLCWNFVDKRYVWLDKNSISDSSWLSFPTMKFVLQRFMFTATGTILRRVSFEQSEIIVKAWKLPITPVGACVNQNSQQLYVFDDHTIYTCS